MAGDAVQAAATQPNESRQGQTPRREGPRHRASRNERFARDDRGKQSRNRPPSENRAARAGGRRDDRVPRRRQGPHRERDRDGPRRKPEPKLYQLEAIVDRGFEDVPDAATEGATRRVDWTILKRTTGDRNAARTVSAVYVVRRDGVDTEFPQLSAARAAVNKTIHHPEKLTLSKSDHAAAKGAKK